MYLQWVIDQSATKYTWKTIAELREKENDLKRQALKLRKQLVELHKKKHDN